MSFDLEHLPSMGGNRKVERYLMDMKASEEVQSPSHSLFSDRSSDVDDSVGDPDFVPGTPNKSEVEEEHSATWEKRRRSQEEEDEDYEENDEERIRKKKRSLKPRKECSLCHAKVRQLSEHLKVHVRHGTMTERERSTALTSQYRRRGSKLRVRPCLLENCGAMISVQLQHYRVRHKLSRNDPLYLDLVQRHKMLAYQYRSQVQATTRSLTDNSDDDDDQATGGGSCGLEEGEKFKEWLGMRRGGGMTDKQVSRAMKQVDVLVQYTGAKSIVTMTDMGIVEDKFCKAVKEKWQPGTTKIYIQVIDKIFKFVQRESLLPLEELGKRLLEYGTVKRWYNKLANQRHKVVQERDAERLIEPQHVVGWYASPFVQVEIPQLLEKKVLSPKDYDRLQEYAAIAMAIPNAPRTGLIANVLSQDVLSPCKVIRDGEAIVVKIREHKTSTTYGAARMFADGLLTKALRVLANRGAENVFLRNGAEIDSSQAGKEISKGWARGGQTVHFTCTLYRKSAVSVVKAVKPQIGERLAQFMNHRLATQEKYYTIFRRTEEAEVLGEMVNKIMTGQGVSPEEKERGEGVVPEEVLSVEPQPQEVEHAQAATVPTSVPKPQDNSKVHPRRAFTPEEVEMVFNVLPPRTYEKVPNLKKVVRGVYQDSQDLQQLASSKGWSDELTIEKIRAKIMYGISKLRK